MKFNKSKFKEHEEMLTSDFTPLQIRRGPDITNPPEQEAETTDAENLRSESPENISPPARGQSTASHQVTCSEDPPKSNQRPARHKPTRKFLEYITDQYLD